MYTLDNLLGIVKDLFEREQFLAEPEELYAPIDYTLSAGGKRIRPVMLLAACQMFGGDIEQAKNAALGIETFHNFTLLHDDLMDQSPIRRGRPTVYRKWNENVAVLSGDTMYALAWRYFLRTSPANLRDILNTFNETCIGVCEGQQHDMNFETRTDVGINEYIGMIRLKTAVLLAGALKIGALYAQAPADDTERLYRFGINLGIAFQLQDDLLDAWGDVATFGKQTGTDILDNKKTFLFLKALQVCPDAQRRRLAELFATKPADTAAKVREVLDIYSQNNIRALVEKEIENYFAMASRELDAIALPAERKEVLCQLSAQLLGRKK